MTLRLTTKKEKEKYGEQFKEVKLQTYNSQIDMVDNLELLQEDEEKEVVKIIDYGDLKTIKSVLFEHSFLDSNNTTVNIEELEGVPYYKLYNSYRTTIYNTIYQATVSQEESFTSLIDAVKGIKYGIILLEC